MAAQQSTTPTESFQRFVEYVERLHSRQLIKENDLRAWAEIKGDTAAGSLEVRHHEPDEENLRSYLLAFRKCVSDKEPVFVNRIFNLAHRHITDDELVEFLAGARQAWKQSMREGTMGFVVNDEQVTPEEFMDLWINGEYFHDDPEKRARLEALAGVPLSRWMFLSALVDATNLVFYLGNMLRLALRDGHVSDDPVR